MDPMLIVIPALLILIALAAPRYGVDSRDPSGRHRRGATIAGDVRALARLITGRGGGQVRHSH
ncbi:MAG: hypothetical protein OJJ54_20745 [Pseudonocardia sp.]|nr:hypothetical protein [Pseudonocardia sp.]